MRAAYARHGIGVIPRALQGPALVRGLVEVPLVHPPGCRWEYGSSTDLLGQVVEAVSGARLGEFLRARLFEPFFTTKGSDRGTGLGMGICKGIVESHGGHLEVESVQGVGTTMTVVLPLRPT